MFLNDVPICPRYPVQIWSQMVGKFCFVRFERQGTPNVKKIYQKTGISYFLGKKLLNIFLKNASYIIKEGLSLCIFCPNLISVQETVHSLIRTVSVQNQQNQCHLLVWASSPAKTPTPRSYLSRKRMGLSRNLNLKLNQKVLPSGENKSQVWYFIIMSTKTKVCCQNKYADSIRSMLPIFSLK